MVATVFFCVNGLRESHDKNTHFFYAIPGYTAHYYECIMHFTECCIGKFSKIAWSKYF